MKIKFASQPITALFILGSLTACSGVAIPVPVPGGSGAGGAVGNGMTAGSEGNSCQGDYFNGAQPRLVNGKLANQTRAVCFSEYSVLHSGVTRTPLWASERLTAGELLANIDRKDNFHAEPSLPAAQRAELVDYANSGYDRGHLAPAADMPTVEAMSESFSLANMTPQNPTNNRGLWSAIESKTRSLAMQRGELFVVSGAVFAGATLQRINNRVLVPSNYFKAVYDANTGESGAYWVANDANRNYKVVSIAELTQLAGIDPFPGISAASKAAVMPLPQP